MEAYAKLVARKCLRIDGALKVEFAEALTGSVVAAYGNGLGGRRLIFSVGRLGVEWFDRPPATTWEIERLLIHELGHERGTHLEADYDDALCEIGARLSCLKATNPELFVEYVKQEAVE